MTIVSHVPNGNWYAKYDENWPPAKKREPKVGETVIEVKTQQRWTITEVRASLIACRCGMFETDFWISDLYKTWIWADAAKQPQVEDTLWHLSRNRPVEVVKINGDDMVVCCDLGLTFDLKISERGRTWDWPKV